MADQQGTGKHPHKSTEEPYSHHEAPSTRNEGRQSNERRESQSRESESSGKSNRGESESESRDLKEREYRDKEGNIHHHTHTSSEMDKKAS